jgi:Zn-dependent M28 family amino/carboxypeptidase
MDRIPRRTFICIAAAMIIGGCGQPAPKQTNPAGSRTPFTPEGDRAAKEITTDFLRDQIARISSDEFEGRGPASAGDRRTRAYLIEQLKSLGYQPGGGAGQWEQPFDIVGITAQMPKQWVFRAGGKSLALKWWDQYIAGSGVQERKGSVKNAEIVFVGYGIQAPEYGWDDFKGQDLKNKILLMLNNDPDWDPALFGGNTRLYYGRWTYKYESAARQGAAGAIIIHTTPSAGYPFQVVQTSWSGEQFELPSASEPRIQIKAWTTEDAARRLTALAGQDLDKLVESAKSKAFKPVPLGVTTSIDFANKIQRTATANVFGVLPGGDPTLREQLVVYSAHHDHLGIGAPDDKGDKIYNGALDNASGMAQVLAIARAYRALPTTPRRSIMMLFVAAEEQGTLGSEYFAQHPTVPAGKIAANINYDGGDIWGRTRDVTYVGKGKSTLDPIVDAVAGRQGRTVKPDQFPDRGYFYRSDQFSFANVGVPALYLDTGTEFIGKPEGWGRQQLEYYEEHHYHQPSDEIRPDWNFDGMIEDASLGFWTGLIVANADDMPAWLPGDEFEAARKAAISRSK